MNETISEQYPGSLFKLFYNMLCNATNFSGLFLYLCINSVKIIPVLMLFEEHKKDLAQIMPNLLISRKINFGYLMFHQLFFKPVWMKARAQRKICILYCFSDTNLPPWKACKWCKSWQTTKKGYRDNYPPYFTNFFFETQKIHRNW